ncbi:MAG: hypothetical protein LBL13_01215 [Bacteroidales bacterium]|jgi:hypothetical protein|nr:hypothetical protein [Bacteroidales bacterium]
MRRVFFSISMMIISVIAFTQTAMDETITFDKKNVSGVSIVVSDYDVKLTSAAIQYRFEQVSGLKGATMKGFRYYQSQPFSEFGALNYDIYTRVTTIGKRKEQKTIIYLLVSTGNENFVTPASNPDIIDKVKSFLNNFLATDLRQYDIDQKSNDQQKTILKLEKETTTLTTERDKLKKQLEDKEKAIIMKQDELTKAKEALNSLKATR